MKKYSLLFILLMNLFSFAFSMPSLKDASTTTTGSVTVVDNGTTVTLSNQFVSVTISKADAYINSFMYDGENILAGGYDGGKFYWSWNMPNYQNPYACTYELTVDPSTNNYDYAEIKLHMTWNQSTATAAQDVDIYYGIKDGVSGLYATGKLSHPASYPANPGGEWRMAAYVGIQFDWLVVDKDRNMVIPNFKATQVAVTGAPKEVTQITSPAPFINHYECKYDYSADFGETDTWGWVSTSTNRGIWMTMPSMEYYPGGPMKRELMCHAAPVMLNMIGGTHYAADMDGTIASGEEWQKIYGPFLIYCNKVPSGTTNVPKALWDDAKTQTQVEKAKWPYSFFSDATYLKADQRGTVTGKLVINDPTEPTASAANMWVGVTVPPSSTTGNVDFQLMSKNYQFWVKTDNQGNFTIPNVIAGVHTLYAFGTGAAGQLTKNAYVTVNAGATTDLGIVEWIPYRVARTIWEIGIPDRTSKEFKHGDDYWVGGTYPDPNWAKFMNYKTEFPDDVSFTIGKSNWATDWNYVQPYNIVGTAQTAAPEWKVNFNLTTAPEPTTISSIYVAAASSFAGPLFVKVNGINITTPTTGIEFPNSSNATIRKGNHGAFGDLRFNFSSSLLKVGDNVISFTQRRAAGDIQYDYLRLESPITMPTPTTTPPPTTTVTTTTIPTIVVYPNPFVDVLSIKLGAKPSNVEVQITTIDGKVVYQKQIIKPETLITLNLSHLKSGFYLMKVVVDKSELFYKISK